MKGLFLAAACVSILAVLLISGFLFANGLPAMARIGPLRFLFGTEWRPANDLYGIFPMILGSLYVTAGALLLGVPLGLLTAGTVAEAASGPFDSARTLAVHMYCISGEGLYLDQGYAAAVVLLVLALCLNILSGRLAARLGKEIKLGQALHRTPEPALRRLPGFKEY